MLNSLIRKPPLLLMALLCALLWGSAFPVIKSVYAHWTAAGVEFGLFEIWLLPFGIYLEFGACDLSFPVCQGSSSTVVIGLECRTSEP